MRRALFIAVVLGTLVFASVAMAQGKKGGGSNPPPAPLPPYRYQIQFFEMPGGSQTRLVNDMNNEGQVVGWYVDGNGQNRGFLYDPQVNAGQAIDLNALASAPDGWRIASGTGLNNVGQLVGYLVPVEADWGDIRRGFVLDFESEQPTLQVLPDLGLDTSYGAKINDFGDVLGAYKVADSYFGAFFFNLASSDPPVDFGRVSMGHGLELNNPTLEHDTQVVLVFQDSSGPHSPAIWSPSSGFQWLPGTDTFVNDINDHGVACGQTSVQLDSRKRNSTTRCPFRFQETLQPLTNVPGSAVAINSQGDLACYDGLYQDGWGLMTVDQLVDTTDSDYPIWSQTTRHGFDDMADRTTPNGLGMVVGRSSDGRNYLLIPVAIP